MVSLTSNSPLNPLSNSANRTPVTAGKIQDAAKAIVAFLRDLLGADAKLIKAERAQDGGWLGYAEVYEESVFMKSLGRGSRVMDRNIYEVRLDANLDAVSYSKRKDMDL